VILLRANNESRNKRERARQAQSNARRKARERHIPITAQCPAWLAVSGRGDARHFVVDKYRARIVRRIFTLSAAGMGQNRIAHLFNEQQVPTFTYKPRWRGAAVAHILASKAVIGVFHPASSIIENGKPVRVLDPEGPIAGYYPAVVSNNLYDRGRAAAEARQTCPGRPKEWAYSNLVARLGRCIVCGDSLYLNGSFKRRFSYLRCAGSLHKDCCNNSGFPYSALEAMLLALDDLTGMVARFISHREHQGASPARRIADAEARIARVKRDLKRLVFTLGNLTGAAARLAKRQIERLNQVIQAEEEKLAEAEVRLQHASFANGKQLFARFRAAKANAGSLEPQERYLSRAVLVAELRKLIEVVILHEHRIATIHMNRDKSGCRVVYVIDPYGIHGMQVEAHDGAKGFITSAALVSFDDTFTSGGQPLRKLARRPHKLQGLLKPIPVAQTPSGDWRTTAPSKAELPGIVDRAERLIKSGAILIGEERSRPRSPSTHAALTTSTGEA
jgi:hypothetical protein